MNGCPRLDDAASYVLRAMPDGDCDEYRFHLADCASCTEKVQELEFVSDALLSAAPQLSAPPQIRGRVMAVVRAESELLRAAGPAADRPAAAAGAGRRFRRLSLRPWPATVLASALLAVGVGGGVFVFGGEQTRRSSTYVAQVEKTVAPDGRARLQVGADSARLVVSGLPAPREGRIYQVWLDHPGDRQPPEATDVLFSVNRKHSASVDVPGDLSDVGAVLVTDEPLGGSQVPTGTPVIKVRLS